MITYVVGFALDDMGRVALIRKNRPDWQAGKLNGIGGHMEGSDGFPLAAMRREFQEETGVLIKDWNALVTMHFPGATIFFYRARVPVRVLDEVRTTTDEEVSLYFLDDMHSWNPWVARMLPNLAWLLPLAAYTADTYQPITVYARVAESAL